MAEEITVSTDRLPRPADWSRRDSGAWFPILLPLGVFAALGAFAFGLRNPVAGSIVGAVVIALLIAAYLLPRPAPARVAPGEVRLPDRVLRGPRFPLRTPRVAPVVWAVLAVILLGSAVVLVVAAIVQEQVKVLAGIPVLTLFGALFVVVLIRHLRRDRTNPPSITLTEPGVAVVLNAARLIGWDEIVGVTAARPGLGVGLFRPRQNAITIQTAGGTAARGEFLAATMRRGQGDVMVRTVQFDCDPVLAYHAIRFYWRNPPARAGLGTGAAIERIRSARLAS